MIYKRTSIYLRRGEHYSLVGVQSGFRLLEGSQRERGSRGAFGLERGVRHGAQACKGRTDTALYRP